jgi:hypothetical protein
MKKTTTVLPYLFGDYLVLSLSKDWLRVFGEIPKFTVSVDERSLTLRAAIKRKEGGKKTEGLEDW